MAKKPTHLPRQPHRGPRIPEPFDSPTAASSSQFGWSSTNWSGYAIASNTSGTYQSVSAAWKVPQVKASSQPTPAPSSWWQAFLQWFKSLFGTSRLSDAYSATWIGIDGFNDQSLIQCGTSQNIVNGSPQYNAWWEILPNPETPIDSTQYPLDANDQIVADISKKSDGTWTITMQNQTKGWTFLKNKVQYSGPQTSVEWIEEAPMVGYSVAALADYGGVFIHNCTVNGGNPHLQPSQSGVMVQNGQTVSTPSSPGLNGNDFNLQYGATVPNSPSS
ncbi:hypothetical protein LLE49_27115 [Alicyclobacillus tolerans]|uniref:G1 family glutamic endopeptidase n=1 Tax=Alicyclobacillus tolerans TaxID=90970 RepID=UPI001F000DAB|nr:G1 family glutamic endopeptidase [Alicyclobacillus tolerans]MCF8568393.1 hypothetical protein [Alicyclobacillus tolerans]